MTLTVKLSLGLIVLMCTSCSDGPREATNPDQAVEVANQYMADNLPQVDLGRREVSTQDLGDRWSVTYHLPEGGTGGPITFFIDKRNAQVVDGDIRQ